MVEHLPRNSAYGEAVATDVEAAEHAERLGVKPGKHRPSVREWSPEVELLAAIFNRLSDVVQVQMEKKYAGQSWSTPETAADILRRRESARRRARVRELFYPK